jgi:hypothetical protein
MYIAVAMATMINTPKTELTTIMTRVLVDIAVPEDAAFGIITF